MSAVRLYFKCLGASVRSQMQHRLSFFMLTAGHALVVGMEFAGVWMLFSRFGQLRGWTFPQVALLFGMANVSFALAEGVGRGFDLFGSMVKSGDFDRLLLRPQSTALQVAAQEVQLMRVGRLALGLLALLWAITHLQLPGGNFHWLGIASGILGGTAVFYGLFILQAALAFWTVESLEVMNTVTYGGVEVAQYPLSIYRPWFRAFFTVVVPLGFTTYFPVRLLLAADPAVPVQIHVSAPLIVGGLFLWLSLRLWEVGVRHYRSTGS